MSYMLLIVESAGHRGSRSPDAGRNAYRRMLDYAEQLRKRGVLVASNSLRSEAVRLSVHEGRRKVVDGPFTEAKECVGGFFLLDCPTRSRRSVWRVSAPRRNGPRSKCARWVPVTSSARRARYICAAHELHHPLAFTSLPANSWQGPWAEPLAP